MNRLDGKVAIVTGAGSGNGRAIAQMFVEEGARVVVADRDADGAQTTAAGLREHGRVIRADVAIAADCERLVEGAVEAFGRLDVLVNNAGIWRQGTVESFSEADWDGLMAVNVKGVFLCSKYAILRLAQAGGSIINISSQAGLIGTAGSVLYAASKHAVVGMTKCMALDYAAVGIRVNAICPGPIETPMLQTIYAVRGGVGEEDAYRERYRRRVPLGRLGLPEDVAQAAVHLASEEAAWVTGICYSLDGGIGLTQRR